MVLTANRPPWLEDRRIPGHWEGDLIMGSKNQSQIGTLVERTTRYVKLVYLPEGKTAGYVAKRINETIKDMPREMLKALTWGQGSELAEYKTIELANNIKIYFCDPASPWQRGTNENTNSLLRDWCPKGTDLSIYTQQDLDEVALILNNRPRQTLNWNTPAESYQLYLRNQPL